MQGIKDFVIVDTETTGYSPHFGARVIEVGAIKVRNLKVVESFDVLVKTVDFIPLQIIAICGITAEMLSKMGEDPESSFFKLREFIGNDVFVGHNVTFDLGFLSAEFSRYEIKQLTDNLSVDTLVPARKGLPDLGNHKLETIKKHFGMDIQSHRALNDTYVCLEIMKRFNKFAKARKTYFDNLGYDTF
jgi:DNA polymerase III epsilon subunit family exonuclease